MIYGDFIVADVFNLALLDQTTLKPILVEEDLTDCGLELTTSTTMVKAGQGNKVICVLRGEKELTVECTMPKVSLNNMAYSLGQDILTGEGVGITSLQKKKLDSSLKMTLKQAPKTEDNIAIYVDGEMLAETTDYTLAGKEITFVGTKAIVGKTVMVYPYEYTTTEKAKKIVIDTTSFPQGTILTLSTYAINKNDQKEGVLQFRFDNAVGDGALSFSTTSERKAVENKIKFTIVSDDEDQLGEILFIPNEA